MWSDHFSMIYPFASVKRGASVLWFRGGNLLLSCLATDNFKIKIIYLAFYLCGQHNYPHQIQKSKGKWIKEKYSKILLLLYTAHLNKVTTLDLDAERGRKCYCGLIVGSSKNITWYDSPRTSPAAPPFTQSKQPSIKNRDWPFPQTNSVFAFELIWIVIVLWSQLFFLFIFKYIAVMSTIILSR